MSSACGLSRCGDGFLDTGAGEVCDDGNTTPGDGCSATCTIEPGFECSNESTISICRPICGDGIVTLGEECDDGVNDGGYDQCAPGCVLGPRCGDGILQPGEDCDDGNRVDGDGCGSACRNIMVH